MQPQFSTPEYTEQVLSLSVRGQRVSAHAVIPAAGPYQPRALLFLPGLFRGAYGPGRTFVTMSRKLASQGFCSLRIEWPGSANSEGTPADAMSLELALDTVQEALRAIHAAVELRRVVAIGLCWGGQVGFSAYYREPAIEAVVAWSPPYERLQQLEPPALTTDRPVLFIFADGDPIAPDSLASYQELCSTVQIDARFITLPDTGHTFAADSALRQVQELTERFLAQTAD